MWTIGDRHGPGRATEVRVDDRAVLVGDGDLRQKIDVEPTQLRNIAEGSRTIAVEKQQAEKQQHLVDRRGQRACLLGDSSRYVAVGNLRLNADKLAFRTQMQIDAGPEREQEDAEHADDHGHATPVSWRRGFIPRRRAYVRRQKMGDELICWGRPHVGSSSK